MAKNTPSLYEQMRDSLVEVQTYEQSTEEAKREAETSQAAVNAAGRKSPEAAQALQQTDNSRHKLNFLEAGLADSRKGFESNFLKNRSNLEAILGSKDVSPALKGSVFSYEPSLAKGANKKYEEASKLHKKITPMLQRFSQYRGKELSKDQDDQFFAEMARDIIEYYDKNEKDPLYKRAFIELAGGSVEKDKDGKIKVKKDKEGKAQIAANGDANKRFVALRYEGLIEEQTKKFMDLVGNDLPGYVSATLPDKYDKAKGFYTNIVNSVESKKQKK